MGCYLNRLYMMHKVILVLVPITFESALNFAKAKSPVGHMQKGYRKMRFIFLEVVIAIV